jgi:poly(3-hydroxybutyrate) depolymerase
VTDDVLPWIERELGHADATSRFVQGNSNGAAWALSMCLLDPDRFAGAIAFFVAGNRSLPVTRYYSQRYALAAGIFEPELRHATFGWRDALVAAGHDPVVCTEHVNGHDWRFWVEHLPTALVDVVGAP